MKKILLILSTLFLMNCAYSIHDYHVSDYDPRIPNVQSTTVESYSEKFIILGFSTNVDYAKEAYNDLLSKCPNGTISGTHTQYSTALGFLSYTQKISMKGECIQ